MNGGAYRSYPLASSLSIGDLNQDKYPDLIIIKYGVIYTSGYSPFGDGSMSVFINKGNGIFDEPVEYSTDKWPKSIGLGDFNNDEYIDVAIGNSSSRTVSIFMNEGNGSFGEKIKHTTKNDARSIAVGKLDHDGYDDLVVTNYYDNTLSVFINKGAFEDSTDYAVAHGPRCVLIEDFNQDGYNDLAVIKSDDTLSVLLNTGSPAMLNTDSYEDSGMKTDLSTVQVPLWYFQPWWWYQWGTVQDTFPSLYQDPGLKNGWFTDENFIIPFYCFPYFMEITGHMLYEDQFAREWPFGDFGKTYLFSKKGFFDLITVWKYYN
ncbi:MAG: VCBS repeat-containing protein [bacterium]